MNDYPTWTLGPEFDIDIIINDEISEGSVGCPKLDDVTFDFYAELREIRSDFDIDLLDLNRLDT